MTNREITFRAWDRSARKMSPKFSLFGEFIMTDAIHSWQQESEISESSLKRIHDLDVMQFSGIYDENENEICEGDIICIYPTEWINGEPERKELIDVGVVLFDDGGFCIDYKGEDCFDELSIVRGNSCILIIGNIYENPRNYTKQTTSNNHTKTSGRISDIDKDISYYKN